MRDVVIAGAVRTAIGRFGGALANASAVELGATVVREAVCRVGLAPEDVEEVVLGQALQAGCGCNPARQAALKAGLPMETPAFTVNKVCASGMKALTLAAMSVASGEQDIVVAGGMENMSAVPYALPGARWGERLGSGALRDLLLHDALHDPGEGCHMGVTAENLAEEFCIGRREQDAFALASQQKAVAAIEEGRFEAEIVPVLVARKKGDALAFDVDEFPRSDTTAEALALLKPAFKEGGTVTAGNASGINDGAAAMVVLSADEAEARGIRPIARVVSYASAGVAPLRMGMGPVPATREALRKARIELGDIELIEINEAFAAQTLAVMRELDLDTSRVNPNGGAIALGHPAGASGARIVVTLLHAMAQQGSRLGLATLCIGGGQGMAVVLEACDT